MHPVDPPASTAPANPNASEIAFLHYRLEVIERWPPSDLRDALIAATVSRLQSLADTEPSGFSAP